MTDSKVISRGGKFWEFMDMDGSEDIPLRRLIWNVRSGQDVASWGGIGKLQQPEVWGTDHRRYPSKVKIDSVVSLSPTGKYVAEGGSGSVSVYALRP